MFYYCVFGSYNYKINSMTVPKQLQGTHTTRYYVLRTTCIESEVPSTQHHRLRLYTQHFISFYLYYVFQSCIQFLCFGLNSIIPLLPSTFWRTPRQRRSWVPRWAGDHRIVPLKNRDYHHCLPHRCHDLFCGDLPVPLERYSLLFDVLA